MTMEIKIPYRPHEGQLRFHKERYKYKYRLLCGGTGSGKTFAGISEDLYWLLVHAGIVGYVFEPTYPMVKRILIPTLEDLLGVPLERNPLIEVFNKGDMRIDFVNGSRLWMGSLDNPERAEGPNIDFIHVDEARLIRNFETAWRVIQRRLRGSGKGHPIGSWVTTTPDHPGSPLYNFFEGPEHDPESRVYRMSLMDNVHLDQGYIDAVKRAHTGGLYKRFIEGVFADVSLGSFNFDYAVHVQQFDEHYNPEAIKQLIYGVDFGWTNPAAIMTIAVDGDGRAYILDEFYKNQTPEAELTEEAKTFLEDHGQGRLFCDRSEPRTINEFRKAGLKAYPDKSKRDDGIRELGGRFQDAGDGMRRIYIHPDCVNLISELQTYDADRKENDHAVDALRYGLMGYRPPKTIQVSTARIRK